MLLSIQVEKMVPSKWALAKPFPIQGVGDKEEIFSQLFHVTKIERSSGSIDHLVRYKLNLNVGHCSFNDCHQAYILYLRCKLVAHQQLHMINFKLFLL